MPWARIDDGFHDHPKVVEILEEESGAAAIGLWLVCLTWAHRHTRSKPAAERGFIPHNLPRRMVGQGWRPMAELLEKHRMWELRDGGWLVHDFAEYLPSDDVRAKRSEAGRKGMAARWGKDVSAGGDNNLLPDPNKPITGGYNKPLTNAGSGRGTGSSTMVEVVDTSARPEITDLCQHLADRIVANGVKRRPVITKAWRDACRLMIDNDGHTPDQIRKAIDFATTDEFWRANILSMPKLREKYEQLRLTAQRNGRPADAALPVREEYRLRR